MTSSANNIPSAKRVDSRTGLFSKGRIANFKRLIQAMRTGEMNRTEAADLLNITLQNASRYFCDLAKLGVTEYAPGCHHNRPGRAVSHRLVVDTQHIENFLNGLEALKPSTSPGRTARASIDPSRHFHLIHRDSLICDPIADARPDPLALPLDFFAPPVFITESPQCTHFAKPVIPPKPPGFPVPANYRFEIGAQA